MPSLRVVGSAAVGILVLGVIGAAAIIWRPAIAAIEPPASHGFDAALIKRGQALAAIGNCNDCHTVRGGKDFAGGLPVPTPFGTIYSSNITPDPTTGIGRWSEAAFRRAMKEGVDRDGNHLYPTFPYDHFTNVSDDDNRALYAYLMTRAPIQAPPLANQLSFPFNQRVVIAGWKLLFLRHGNYQPDSSQTAEWNRGAYLVEGLAHCGACHTPRNALGAERGNAQFAGGEVDNWQAYALNAGSSAPVPWNADALAAYLRNGWHPDHGVARGPMAQVVSNLSSVSESDVHAIATYMASVFGAPSDDRKRRGDDVLARVQAAAANPKTSSLSPKNADQSAGAAIFAAACATCHETGRSLPYGGVNLNLSTAMNAPDARNAINTILSGIRPVEGERSPIMPGFASTMSDAQIVELLQYLRSRFSNNPAWTDLAATVQAARQSQPVFLQTSASPQNSPVDATQRDKP
jgi:mono/diheme cytochrome c family protein